MMLYQPFVFFPDEYDQATLCTVFAYRAPMENRALARERLCQLPDIPDRARVVLELAIEAVGELLSLEEMITLQTWLLARGLFVEFYDRIEAPLIPFDMSCEHSVCTIPVPQALGLGQEREMAKVRRVFKLGTLGATTFAAVESLDSMEWEERGCYTGGSSSVPVGVPIPTGEEIPTLALQDIEALHE